jgi:glutaminyl-peptide cyclotransferase
MKKQFNKITTTTSLLTAILLLTTACQSTQQPGQGTRQSEAAPTQVATATQPPKIFDGERALEDVAYQVSLGSRTPGTPGHSQAGEWIKSELTAAGWETQIQNTELAGQPIRNVIGKWGEGEPWLILGAHYDTRQVADQDPDPAKQSQPVPGANDGASGVATLLELARILPAHAGELRYKQIWLVFFDAEDNGDLPGATNTEQLPSNGWILGSRAFVSSLSEYPNAAVIIDMIGDADQNIYQEQNSDLGLTTEIWSAASELGYSSRIIPQMKWSMTDDHTPFLQAGIPAVDMIDFDYPYWHTTGDLPDKVSGASLKTVGDTLLKWITTPSP